MQAIVNTEVAKLELGKFFQLHSEGVELTMPSRFIDDVWHKMLDNEKEYEDFCLNSCGKVVVHAPSAGEGIVPWVPEYEARFGKLPEVWFVDEYGQFDQVAYSGYLKKGKWYAGWDCRPAWTPM